MRALTDIANTMPHMIAGRLHQEDFEALCALPDGTLTIDLLTGTASHSGAGPMNLQLVADLVEWLNSRLATARRTPAVLNKAELKVVIRTDRVAADRTRIVPFDLVTTATFAANNRVVASKPVAALRWYRRDDGMVMD